MPPSAPRLAPLPAPEERLTPSAVARRLALTYGALGALWILTSGRVLGRLVHDADVLLTMEMYKGWFFVAVTTILLFLLARSLTRRALSAESDSRATQQRFAQVADLAPAGIFTLDLAGRCTYSNTRWKQMSGCDDPAVPWPGAVHPDDLPAVASKWEMCLRDRTPCLMEFRFRHADGRELRVLGQTVPEHGLDGECCGFIGACTDITELAEVKTVLRDTEARFRQAQKMEAIGLLAGGIAHDFNNLLTVIQGNAGLLQFKSPGGPTSGPLTEIVRAANRAADLTRQLLTFSRKQVLEPKVLDLNEVVTDTFKLLKRIISEDISVTVEPAGIPVPVHADAGMMDQVLMNLVINARDALPAGGAITIRTGSADVTAGEAGHDPSRRPGRFACISVSDTGCGIAPEHLPRIFEPFFTTKSTGQGTGLGLATVFGIVRQHQGWIDVTSEVGCGTRFEVYLPWYDGAAELAAPRVATSARGGAEHILVVEDEPAIRDLLAAILETKGYQVSTATTGREALEVWDARGGEFDLLLTDLVMPDGINGRQLAEQFRARRPGLRVLFSSGYGVEAIDREFLSLPGVGFLQKPFVPTTLLSTVREQLDAA